VRKKVKNIEERKMKMMKMKLAIQKKLKAI
jgi:hypothetical protein